MQKAQIEDADAPPVWKYTPGLWVRSDGARAERVKTGHRAGVWKARKPDGDYILTQTVEPVVPRRPWQGYSYAKGAKAALDALMAKCNLEND